MAGNKAGRANKFKVFTDEHRLKIIELLCECDRTVNEIATALGLPQNLTSHHLATLKDFGILRAAKNGRTVTYSMACQVSTRGGQKVLNLDCCTVILK